MIIMGCLLELSMSKHKMSVTYEEFSDNFINAFNSVKIKISLNIMVRYW